MTFNIKIYQRNLSNTSQLAFPGMSFEVERMAWTAQGGPDWATVKVKHNWDAAQAALRQVDRNTVELLDVWEMLEILRCPVVITDEQDDLVWWGFVQGSMVQDQRVQVGVSLEKMTNKTRVVYSRVNVAGTVGERAQTDWVQDDLSISEYGTRQRQSTMNQANDEQAEARRDTLLERLKYPLVQRVFGEFGEPSAYLNLSGWFSSLDWLPYENSSGKEGYETIGDGLQAFGNAAGQAQVAQSFQLAGAVSWAANVIRVRMKKEEAPVDTLTLRLRSDSAGAPGATLATATMNGADVSENLNWHEFTLSARVALAASTTYWISLERSGAADAVNYYKVDGNEDLGYTRGVFRIWNGSAWVARSPDADMLFAVSGVAETSGQVDEIAVTAGQFFSDVSVQVNSGVYSSPYRDGDRSALAEIRDLLESGTTNGRRMLATVSMDRELIVTEEPAPGGSSDYLVDNQAKMYDLGNNELKAWRYPVGVWARLKGVVPSSVDTARLADPTMVFVEDVIYDARTNKAAIRERDASRMLEVE